MKLIKASFFLSLFITMPVLATINTLTVYTYGSFAASHGPGPKIKQAFEKQCQCNLKFITLDDSVGILNRLRLEGEKTQADVVLGLDNNLMKEAKQTGLFTHHKTKTDKIKLPITWSNDTFIPFDYGHFSFIYNQKKLKKPPKSFSELFERDDISIIYQDPRTSTVGQGLLLWIKNIYGDDATKAWKALAKKTLTVTKGWSEAYGLFLNNEADLVLSYTTSPAYHFIEQNNFDYQSVNFAEGHYLQIEVAAKIKNSSQPKLADQFLDFILSDEFQHTIATGNWMNPVTDISLPPLFSKLQVPQKSLQLDNDAITQNRRKWIREWQRASIL